MRISVIIPTFNRRETLPRALESVFSQTLPADEVILVDDGSVDGSGELIKHQYPQCRLLQQPNQGVSSARNSGISAAKGDWIALLDSDDAWHPEKLEKQMDRLEQSQDLRICHTEEIWIRSGKRVNAMKKHAKSGGRIFQRCLPLCVISPSAVVLHRSLFDEYGLFDETLPACEDYDLWLRLCAHEEVCFLPEPLTIKYGGHDDQLSHKHWGMDRFRVQALEKLIASDTLSEPDQSASLRTLTEKCTILSQGASKRGHFERARHYDRLGQRYQEKLVSLLDEDQAKDQIRSPMINLLVALPAEAKPLIRAFALQRQQPDGEFPLYLSKEISLALCGPGDESMQRAISFLLKRQSTSVTGWINLGIAGHGSLDRGHCLLVDSVTREETGEGWELASLPLDGISRSPLICVSQAESTYTNDCAYDMESAGFSTALARAGLLHRGQIIKVVSDNPRQPAAEINGKMVNNLIEACIPTLSRLMEQLHSHAAST